MCIRDRVDSVLSALVEHTPIIVEQLFDILIGIIQAITTKLPELIVAGVELLDVYKRQYSLHAV